MKNRSLIRSLYEKFSMAEGSQHIASEFAIVKVQELIEHFEVRDVLEIGLGIGSISGSILSLNDNLVYSGTESNDFCLQSLKRNLGIKYPRLKIFHSLDKIPENVFYDMIIIDGADEHITLVKKHLKPSGIIVIEGDRSGQETILQKLFPLHRLVHVISLRKNRAISPFKSSEWQGALKVIFINPTRNQVWWWKKEKLLTKLKYKFPGRYLGK